MVERALYVMPRAQPYVMDDSPIRNLRLTTPPTVSRWVGCGYSARPSDNMFAMLSISPSGPCHAPGRRFLRVDPARHGGCHGAVVIALFPRRDRVSITIMVDWLRRVNHSFITFS